MSTKRKNIKKDPFSSVAQVSNVAQISKTQFSKMRPDLGFKKEVRSRFQKKFRACFQKEGQIPKDNRSARACGSPARIIFCCAFWILYSNRWI